MNSTKRVIKFRIAASFDTVQALAWGALAGDIKFKVCTNWTFRRRRAWRLKKETQWWELRVREKRIAILPTTNRNPSFSCAGTFIKLGSKGTEGCVCDLRKHHEMEGERDKARNARRGWSRPTTIVQRRREVTVQMHFA